jgi:DNA-binding response OmpR family regulator
MFWRAGLPLLGTPLHVLVADDDPDIREMVRTALELDGHQVFEAPDGRTAWELIVARRPALVVADVQMPGLNGLELTALVKANGYLETKVILFTGGMATQKEAQIAGAGAYVTKTAPLSELRAAVSRLCPVARESRPGGSSRERVPKLEA